MRRWKGRPRRMLRLGNNRGAPLVTAAAAATAPSLVTASHVYHGDTGAPGDYASGTKITLSSVTNGLLVAKVSSFYQATAVNLDTVGGVAFTKVSEQLRGNGFVNASMWVLKSADIPTSGTHTICVTAGYNLGDAILELWQDVNQTTPTGTTANTTTPGAGVAFSVTVPCTATDTVTDVAACQHPFGSPSPGQTLTLAGAPFSDSLMVINASQQPGSASGTVSHGYTTDSGEFVAMIAVALKGA